MVAIAVSHSTDPRKWNVAGPKEGEAYFHPSEARTATGNFIPADTLMMDDYCKRCHADVHAQWSVSSHRNSSFNNPMYLASIRETREMGMKRDGNVQASRWCAGCHDPVPFFSGAFDDPNYDCRSIRQLMPGLPAPLSCHHKREQHDRERRLHDRRNRFTIRSPRATTRCCSGSTISS